MHVATKLMLACCAAAMVGAPASAQKTGTRIGKNVKTENVGALTQIIAKCIMERQPKMVRTWMNILPGTDAEDKFVKTKEGEFSICTRDDQLVFPDDQELVFQSHQFRYPVALAIARKQLRKSNLAPAGLNPNGKAWFAAPYAALPAGSAVDHNALVLQDFGHCVASTDWRGSRALLLSEEKSGEEKAAVAALAPVLGPCFPANSKIKLTSASLRRALAEPVVHLLGDAGQ
ncbi:hypothetical protein ACFQPG_06390 [Sphingomonas sp. GCM10030256]|uniref:hypothetical protein n=1 Tax=Sphingomonas sp. GCM10030256 TaxID=3273427 RepID=UPI00360F6C96